MIARHTAEIPATMRCWRSTHPGLAGLELHDLPCPHPGPEDALVQVEAAALNFADLLMIDDKYQIRPERPFTPGQEIAGRVVASGERSRLAPGDRVASKVVWGGFAQYALVRGDMAMRVPAEMPAATAATLPIVYTTALVALTESTTIAPGETVLVLGAAGGVGLAAVEIAHHLGGRVIAVAGGADKCTLAREHGAAHAFDYRREGWAEQVKAAVGEHGVDVIVDPVGGEATRQALRLIAWCGRLLLVGFTSGEVPMIPANRLLLRRASAIGVYWSHDRDGPMLARTTQRLSELAAAGAIRPHVGARFAFGELPQALAALGRRETAGKVVLAVSETAA